MQSIDLKRFRKDNNLTQTQMAEIFGCKQSYISDIERYRRPMPNAYIKALVNRFNEEKLQDYYIDEPTQNSSLQYAHNSYIGHAHYKYKTQDFQNVNEMIYEYETQLSKANLKLSKLYSQLSETKNDLIEAKNQIIKLQEELIKKS